MSTSYDRTLPDDRNHVRFLVQDTSSPWYFQDEEIDAVLEDQTATGAARKYYAAARLLSIQASALATARGAGSVREKRVGKLTLIWGVDRDTLDAINERIAELKRTGGQLLARSSKQFRVITAGNRDTRNLG